MNRTEQVFSRLGFSFSGSIRKEAFSGVRVSFDGTDAVFGFSTPSQEARCAFLLAGKASEGPFETEEIPHFQTLGPMLDMSRGKVMTVAGIKDYMEAVSTLGMNMLMLYTEDLFEVEGYESFGHLRGRYSLEELRELDAYGQKIGVELIPCIQTFGHLEQFIKMPQGRAISDNAKVLMAGLEETYRFIEAEIRAVRKAFRTSRIHLGMDETHGLGLGKYLKKNGYRSAEVIFREHLERVLEIAGRYFERPMIWSDEMFHNPHGKTYSEQYEIPRERIDRMPGGVELVFWDYYHDTEEWYDLLLTQHDRFANPISFGGGVWAWDGLAPNLSYTLKTMAPALRACLKHSVDTVIATVWVSGENGADFHQCLPGLTVFSEFCYRGEACTEEDIYKASEVLCGVDRELFHAISDIYMGKKGAVSLAKAFLYCDPIIDLFAYDLDFDEAIATMERAREIIDSKKEYEHRDFFLSLYRVAILRADLLGHLREAYRLGDKETVRRMAEKVLPEAVEEWEKLFDLFRALWDRNYKGFGLEMYTHDFGGALLRMKDCRRILTEYLEGKRARIEELETPVLKGINKTWRSTPGYLSRFRY